MEHFIARFGLLAIFLGALLEGDVTLLLGGVLAHLGFFELPLAIAAGIAGASIADGACYWGGRLSAPRLRSTAMYERARPLIDRLVRRFGSWEIIAARFVYGTRLPSMLFWGIRGLPFGRFLAFDLVGCSLWAGFLGVLGFVLSDRAQLLVGHVKRVEHWLLAAVILGTALVLGLRIFLRREVEMRDSAPPKGER